MSTPWTARAINAATPGNTFIEVATCYARIDPTDSTQFEYALEVTKGYVRSKIKKGKGAEVAGRGGKLERLEIKYAHLGYQDLFYLTRSDLGLTPSTLRLPRPSPITRQKLEKAGYKLDETRFLDQSQRGRRDSVKDISRSNSREPPRVGAEEVFCAGDITVHPMPRQGSGLSVSAVQGAMVSMPVTPVKTSCTPTVAPPASSRSRSVRTYQDDPMLSPPTSPLPPLPSPPLDYVRPSPQAQTLTMPIVRTTPITPGTRPHISFPRLISTSNAAVRTVFYSRPATPRMASHGSQTYPITPGPPCSPDTPELTFDIDPEISLDPFASALPLYRADNLVGAPPDATNRDVSHPAVSGKVTSGHTSVRALQGDPVTREELRRFEERQAELLRQLVVSRRAKEGVAPPAYRPSRPDWVPEWV